MQQSTLLCATQGRGQRVGRASGDGQAVLSSGGRLSEGQTEREGGEGERGEGGSSGRTARVAVHDLASFLENAFGRGGEGVGGIFSNVFTMRNPGDYVWSSAGFDNIITQLMEQYPSTNAPPPAPEEVIGALPRTVVGEGGSGGAELKDCAVCKENYEAGETYVTLPCRHYLWGESSVGSTAHVQYGGWDGVCGVANGAAVRRWGRGRRGRRGGGRGERGGRGTRRSWSRSLQTEDGGGRMHGRMVSGAEHVLDGVSSGGVFGAGCRHGVCGAPEGVDLLLHHEDVGVDGVQVGEADGGADASIVSSWWMVSSRRMSEAPGVSSMCGWRGPGCQRLDFVPGDVCFEDCSEDMFCWLSWLINEECLAPENPYFFDLKYEGKR
ncbi:hypothetical protein PMAC_000172 [Pneumocystis sp. 'macacae']|nr:hypothetical protein PMAC_000172 [Pneumocystis sp. 'macacae']